MYSYVSLFSGAGGLDIGIERAGFEPITLSDVEPVFCDSLKANQGWTHEDGRDYLTGAKVINCDIREASAKELSLGKKVDLVVGGPPCQAFSSSGKQLSVLDPRGALVEEFCRVVDALKPRMFLFENVRGIVTARNKKGVPGGVINELLEILGGIGYSCRATLLNSADYGSYQRRVRCFIVGSKRGAAPVFPEASFSREPSLFGQKWRSLGDFLGQHADANSANFVYPTLALAQKLSEISDGCGIRSPGKAENTRPGGHWGYRQGTFIADRDLPARTVTGSASQDWVRWGGELRRLTFEEVKKLQGFPSDWQVAGTKAAQFKQMGNAVPSIFGEVLGKVMAAHLDNFPRTPPVKLCVPESFKNAIEYTKKDHAKNKSSRKVHLPFEE
jgi:DNA (cytosine-5)-methyltransferase 1